MMAHCTEEAEALAEAQIEEAIAAADLAIAEAVTALAQAAYDACLAGPGSHGTGG